MVLRLVERTAVLLVSLAVSSVLVFGFMAVLPGDPARVALGVNASDEAVAQLRQQFGLDRPLATQYFDWLGGLLHADFGTSYMSKVAIGPQVFDRLQVTLWLVVVGMIVALVVAVPAGTVMAARHRKISGLALVGDLAAGRRGAGISRGDSADHALRGEAAAGFLRMVGRRRLRTPGCFFGSWFCRLCLWAWSRVRC